MTPHVRILRDRHGLEVYVGPWMARLDWGPGHFSWLEGQGLGVRFIRRWWTGWHRWERTEQLTDPMGDITDEEIDAFLLAIGASPNEVLLLLERVERGHYDPEVAADVADFLDRLDPDRSLLVADMGLVLPDEEPAA